MAKTKIPFSVSIANVGSFTVQATSTGNAIRKAFAVAIHNRQLAERNGSNYGDGLQMSSRLPPVDPDTGLYIGVSCSAVNEHVGRLKQPTFIGKRKKDARYARFPK